MGHHDVGTGVAGGDEDHLPRTRTDLPIDGKDPADDGGRDTDEVAAVPLAAMVLYAALHDRQIAFVFLPVEVVPEAGQDGDEPCLQLGGMAQQVHGLLQVPLFELDRLQEGLQRGRLVEGW